MWVLLFTFGPLVGYLPPRLRPRWLYHVALFCSYALWLVLGVLIFQQGSVILAVVIILAAVCGLAFDLLRAGTSANQKGMRQEP
jgi:hypothetical protein